MAARHPRLTQFQEEHIPHHDLSVKQDEMNAVGKAERKIFDIARLVINNAIDENTREEALRNLGITLNSLSRGMSE